MNLGGCEQVTEVHQVSRNERRGHISVVNSPDGTVGKLRTSDGKNLGTFKTGGVIAVGV